MKVAITSGYFDPLHAGHLDLFRQARLHGDALWVIVNNDFQATLKKEVAFLDEITRVEIIRALRLVDRVILSVDTDRSVCATLQYVFQEIKIAGNTGVFCKGGDSHSANLPELRVLEDAGVQLVLGLGIKTNSSSEILKRARTITP